MSCRRSNTVRGTRNSNPEAAQTAIAVENARAHERLAREEVARANYSRFLPEYVVKQMLENPESFKLGGVSQTITILFADIRGFTRISEHAAPEKIVFNFGSL